MSGAVSFRGWRRNVWSTVARPLTVAHGMVNLNVGARIVDARVNRGSVLASAVIAADDVLSGEHKEADETIGALRIPCEALTPDDLATLAEDDDRGASADDDAP